MWAVFLLHPYLCRTHFDIQTYQGSLLCIVHLKTLHGRLDLWKLRLQKIDFEVFYHSFIKHLEPDELSRVDTERQDDTNIDYEIPVLHLTEFDNKTIETFNEYDPESQQDRPFLNLKQAYDHI